MTAQFQCDGRPLQVNGQDLVDVTRVGHAFLDKTHDLAHSEYQWLFFANRFYNANVGKSSDKCELRVDPDGGTADWEVEYDWST